MAATKTGGGKTPPYNPAALVQALEAHQSELEVQNAELQVANEELGRINHILEVAHGRFRALYELAPTPYVTIDASRVILDVNEAAALILAAPREQLQGGTIDLFLADEHRPRFRDFLAAVFVEGHTRCHDVVLLRADATPVDAMIDGVLLREAADDPPQVVLAIVDITARKLAEAARRQAQDEMLAIVSHDLRGPLNAITLGCDALASGLTPEEHTICVAAIERAAGRCERLIKDLLGIARIESGQLTLDVGPFDVRELVQQVCRDHAPAVDAAKSRLTVSVTAASAPINGDRDRLHQVLSNLIGNALVHARGAAIDVSVIERDATIVIAVQDEGPGIPPDELPVIFEKYRQGTRHRGGAGLGLAIVKGLVEAHHGTAMVTSVPGRGARFEVTLPRCDAPAA
jgi:PAS domain S-box-containing protein